MDELGDLLGEGDMDELAEIMGSSPPPVARQPEPVARQPAPAPPRQTSQQVSQKDHIFT